MRHSRTGKRVVVPVHGGRDLKPGTLHNIIRLAGLTVEEFIGLLKQTSGAGSEEESEMDLIYTVVLIPEPDGGYVVHVPALGCHTQGDDLKEALWMARDAIEGCLAVLEEDGDPLPPDVAMVPIEWATPHRRWYTGFRYGRRPRLPELPVLNGKETVSALLRGGFECRRNSGGHAILKHPVAGLIVPVPLHGGRDLREGTLRGIIRQAGLTVEEFIDLLK
jgi:predicted RNA binding protein YcfA (HicA-like mRNA interferase family)/predicted RNase H-like HicB family nuclease